MMFKIISDNATDPAPWELDRPGAAPYDERLPDMLSVHLVETIDLLEHFTVDTRRRWIDQLWRRCADDE